jgi:hypothetical protein
VELSVQQKTVQEPAIALTLLSLSLAYLLGYGPLMLIFTFLLLGYLYSSGSFDMKHTRLAPFALATYALIPFLVAYYTPTYWLIKIWGPDYNTLDPSMLTEIKVMVPHRLNSVIVATAVLIYIGALVMSHVNQDEPE